MGELADLGWTGAAAGADEPRPGIDPRWRQRRDSSPLASGMPGLGHRVVEIAGCAVSSLLRHVGVMTSETLARAGARGVLVVLEVRVASRRGMTGGVGVRGADITGASALHAEEEPQYSNDPRWEH